MKRVNEIAFAAGMKGSGKSWWLNEHFVSRMPRVIHQDVNGELLSDPDVLPVASYSELLDVLDAFAAARTERWRVAVSLEEDDAERLFDLLAPMHDFGRASLSRALGGVAVECGECDTLAPNGRTRPAIASAWRRGRHHLLSLLMATQRPAACDRLLTSQADVVAIFAQEESIDIQWVRTRYGAAIAEEVANLAAHWCVVRRQGAPDFEIINPAGRVARRVSKNARM